MRNIRSLECKRDKIEDEIEKQKWKNREKRKTKNKKKEGSEGGECRFLDFLFFTPLNNYTF